MKKLWASLLAISFFILTFCGCSLSKPTPPVTEFVSDVSLELPDAALSMSMNSAAGDNVILEVISPESLKGLTFQRANSSLYIEYNGLKCIADADYLADFNPFSVLIDVVISMKNTELSYISNEGDFAVFEGKTETFEYKVFSDKKSGKINMIIIDEKDYKVNFLS